MRRNLYNFLFVVFVLKNVNKRVEALLLQNRLVLLVYLLIPKADFKITSKTQYNKIINDGNPADLYDQCLK